MYNVLQTPVFGIIVTIVFFNLGRYIQRKQVILYVTLY